MYPRKCDDLHAPPGGKPVPFALTRYGPVVIAGRLKDSGMSKKPTLSARETFVLEDDMIDELDEMSWTSVIRDIEDSADEAESEISSELSALNFEAAESAAADSDSQDSDDSEGGAPFELSLIDD